MANLMTTAQVAERLGKSVRTVGRLVASETLRVELTLPGKTGARLYHPAEVERVAQLLQQPRKAA